MTASHGTPSPSPGDGHRWRPSVGYLLAALLLAGGAAALLWLAPPLPDDSAQVTPPPLPSGPLAQATGTLRPAPPRAIAAIAAPVSKPPPEGDADPTRDLSSYVMRGENPTMPEVIERLHKAGIHSGLGAFSPPGTRPPLIGLAVPEDFVLPEGYVRHYQATDDGQRIEAILMFAPDRRFVDAQGKAIAIPANRVVPPEYAPPGLPIRRIVVPKPFAPNIR